MKHIVAAVALSTSACTCGTISSGERGVIFKQFGGGTVTDETVGEGFYIRPITDSIIHYDIKLEEEKETLTVQASNGLTYQVDVSVLFRPDPARLPQLHQTLGQGYYEKVIGPNVRSEARVVAARYLPEDTYSRKREEISKEIVESVKAALAEKPIVLENILIRDVRLPDSIRTAIELKLTADQQQQQMEFSIAKQRKEAERMQVEAEAIARYQQTVRQGLTQEYLRWKGIEATEKLANSPNSKVVVIGSGKDGLPLILGQ
jgi:regulator of protease activity HflC (stomatin/prohibitin superfamily)